MDFKTRQHWENYAGNQSADPLRQYTPSSLDDIVAIVTEAENLGFRVRAIGSGHSWSDVAVTGDFMVLPTNLTQVLGLDSSLRNDVDSSYLVQVESGITIAALNDALDSMGKGKALPNMGGYDGQTIVGAFSTSTHGSGMNYGPLPTMAKSLELVAGGGKIYRIEPTNGITDPGRFAAAYGDRRTLIQDDQSFNATIVSMGCMGILYSVILEVTPSFWLKEVRSLTTWETVRELLRAGDVLKANQHYELLLNPYAINSAHTCLVTTRNAVPGSDPGSTPSGGRNFLDELFASLPIASRIMKTVFGVFPDVTPELLDNVIHGMVEDNYTDKSYRVFNIGAANNLTAYSSELAFPMDGNVYLDGINNLLTLAEKARATGDIYHSGPIALRFVKGTGFHLSPQFGRDTCMAEIIMCKGTDGALELLDRCENASYAFKARPHWGQINSMTDSDGLVESLYPALNDWKTVRRRLDPRGTFCSPFSKRAGLDD